MTASTSESKAFDYIIALIHERCGIRLNDGKRPLIRMRLGKRMRQHGMGTLEEYCDFLQNHADEREFTHVVDALTTNFTRFLREPDHFEFMVNRALPSVLPAGKRNFTIWSAGCATGEEPYSIAFHVAEKYPAEAGWDWRIFATDVSTNALGEARTGIYPLERARSVPREWLKRYCQRGTGDHEGQFRIKDAILGRVSFAHLNLLEPPDVPAAFELIFCRNVMIYFDRPTRKRLVAELARWLVPGGYLFVGHSESFAGLDAPFQCERPGIYRKS